MTTKDNAQWIVTRDRATGRQLHVAVPSASTPGKFHLVSSAGCDCRGFAYRGTCRHFLAVQAERQERATAAQVEEYSGCAICAIDHPCSHCPRLYSRCDCRRVHVPLISRLMA